MDLLTRLATATEAAAAAAQAAAQVSQATASSPTSAQEAQDDRQWHKLVSRPSVFEPKSWEEETGMWKDWFWSVEQFLATVDVAFQAELTEVTNHLNREQLLSNMTPVQQERSHFLYSLMASLLRGRPLQILKAVPNSNGYEAVRQLIGSIQPASRNRSLAMLSSLMSWPQFDLRQSILAQLLKLEEAEREYSRIATELSDEIKFAVLMKSVPPGQLRTYLTVQISDTSSYNDLRSALLRYDTATTKWNSATALGFDNSSQQHGEIAPMDVDRVFNKGDGKGKGKGKDHKGGKGGKSKDKHHRGSWVRVKVLEVEKKEKENSNFSLAKGTYRSPKECALIAASQDMLPRTAGHPRTSRHSGKRMDKATRAFAALNLKKRHMNREAMQQQRHQAPYPVQRKLCSKRSKHPNQRSSNV